MQKFVAFIVDLMKQEKLFSSQSGPIILAQVKNKTVSIPETQTHDHSLFVSLIQHHNRLVTDCLVKEISTEGMFAIILSLAPINYASVM